jgi:hypothetical protein
MIDEQGATPLGTLIDELQAKRLEYDEINAKAKAMAADIEDHRTRIRQALDAVGLESASGHDLIVSTKDTIYGQIEDPDTFQDFVREQGLFWYEQRVSQGTFREYLTLNDGELPPGTTYYTKEDINLRKK